MGRKCVVVEERRIGMVIEGGWGGVLGCKSQHQG